MLVIDWQAVRVAALEREAATLAERTWIVAGVSLRRMTRRAHAHKAVERRKRRPAARNAHAMVDNGRGNQFPSTRRLRKEACRRASQGEDAARRRCCRASQPCTALLRRVRERLRLIAWRKESLPSDTGFLELFRPDEPDRLVARPSVALWRVLEDHIHPGRIGRSRSAAIIHPSLSRKILPPAIPKPPLRRPRGPLALGAFLDIDRRKHDRFSPIVERERSKFLASWRELFERTERQELHELVERMIFVSGLIRVGIGVGVWGKG